MQKTKGKAGGAGLWALSANERRFVDEFMLDRKSTAAAIRCGHSRGGAAKTGKRYMAGANVRAEIVRREHERSRRVDIQTDDILRELKRVAFFDVRCLFGDGGQLLDIDELDEDDARALVNFDIVVLSRDGMHITRLLPGNKLRAIEMLGRYVGIFGNRVERTATEVVFAEPQ